MTVDLSSLEVIDFGSNLIEKVNLNLPKIKVVNLSSNLIKEFAQVGPLNSLEELNLDRNGLTVLPVLKAPSLKKLILTANVFTSIANLSASQLDALEEFRLEQCKLGSAPFPVVNLPEIKSLYVIESELEDVSNLAHSLMPLVEDVNFSNNKITSMP